MSDEPTTFGQALARNRIKIALNLALLGSLLCLGLFGINRWLLLVGVVILAILNGLNDRKRGPKLTDTIDSVQETVRGADVAPLVLLLYCAWTIGGVVAFVFLDANWLPLVGLSIYTTLGILISYLPAANEGQKSG